MSKNHFLFRRTLPFISILFFIILYSFFNIYYSDYKIIDDSSTGQNYHDIKISSSGFAWPVPGFNRITSYFGYRTAPTAGATSYHSGLDIGAPTGSYLVAICDGTIVNAGWTGSGGYTITLVNNNLRISYCHVSPDFIVQTGQIVSRGQVIGQVGPKNVYGVPNNPYKDSSGNPTNGATTGAHLHLTIRKDGQAVDPLNYL